MPRLFFDSIQSAQNACGSAFSLETVATEKTCQHNDRTYTRIGKTAQGSDCASIYVLQENAGRVLVDALCTKLSHDEARGFKNTIKQIPNENWSLDLVKKIFSFFQDHQNFYPKIEEALLEQLRDMPEDKRAEVLLLASKILPGIHDVQVTAKTVELINSMQGENRSETIELVAPFVTLFEDGLSRLKHLRLLVDTPYNQLSTLLATLTPLFVGIRDKRVCINILHAVNLLPRKERTPEVIGQIVSVFKNDFNASELGLRLMQKTSVKLRTQLVPQLAEKLKELSTTL